MKKISIYALMMFSLVAHSTMTLAGDLELGIFELNRGNFDRAIAEFKPLADEGFSPAQVQLALVYQKGYGVKRDLKKAIELFNLAAQKNDLEALFNLAVIYTEGTGVKKDLKKAFQLTKRAAKKDLARAQYNLGVMFHNGEGVIRNYKQAVHWYTMAANQNYTLAQFNLALMYYEGKGVRKNIEKSYLWNLTAANNGYRPALESSRMDEQKLSKKQIETIQTRAEDNHNKIIAQVERANKLAELEMKKTQYNY